MNEVNRQDQQDNQGAPSAVRMDVLDRRTADEREADFKLESLLDEALAPMALVGPPGTSERASLENGLADRVYAASLDLLPRKQSPWAAFRSQRVWVSFAASMAVAVSAGMFIHTTNLGSKPNRSGGPAITASADITAVDQQLSRLASYNGPSAAIDRDLATLSVKLENVPTPSDW